MLADNTVTLLDEEDQQRFRNLVMYGVAGTDEELGLTPQKRKQIQQWTIGLSVVVVTILILTEILIQSH